MNKYDACKILSVSGTLTFDIVKRAAMIANRKYHPDINPAGLEMMKLVNVAKDFFTSFDYEKESPINLLDDGLKYGEALNNAIAAVVNLQGVIVEVCGIWVWLSGNTKPSKDVIKASGFYWASKKKKWYFRPTDYKSKSRGRYSMNDIRAAHGSEKVEPIHRTALK